MLNALGLIVQRVNVSPNLETAMSELVGGVYEELSPDVCSVYLIDPETQELVLLASEGLSQDAVGKIRLSFDEGLVGLVAQRGEPINIADADKHPRYKLFEEANEEDFHAFLGVPIIHYGHTVGVLVIQQEKVEAYSGDVTSFLITLAAQLSGAINKASLSGDIARMESGELISKTYYGLPGSPGLVSGEAVVIYNKTKLDTVPDREIEDVDGEIKKFNAAVRVVKDEMVSLSAEMEKILPGEEHAVFDAYAMMLSSGSLLDDTIAGIKAGNWAAGSLRKTIEEHSKIFAAMSDPYLRERADDIRDLGSRIISKLKVTGARESDWQFPENGILVGDEITATQLGEVPVDRIKGIVSVHGSTTSHVAILARAMQIPCAMGVADLPVSRIEGHEIIIDGYEGQVIVEPSQEVYDRVNYLIIEEQELTEELKEIASLPAETKDKHRVTLFANTGLLSNVSPLIINGAEGVGLYRTEVLYQMRSQFPSEKDQVNVYRELLSNMHPRPVVLRTLDVGGDKALDYFSFEESNPFLGWRGIRLTLDHPEVFIIQLRAMIIADVELNNLRIMFPMVSNVEEVIQSSALVDQVMEELLEEGYKVKRPQLGVMIEVPASVLLIRSFAPYIDFVSIGSNDLTQYMLAVDRNNESVSKLYDSFSPAMIMVIKRVVEDAREHNLHVSICGEFAADPLGAVLLLAMGLDSLSMSVGALGRVKRVIRNITKAEADAVLADVLEMNCSAEIRQRITHELESRGLSGLIRAGK